MIKANELRIGNTIYDRHGNVTHIHAGWFYITQDPKRLEDYSPIPLTEEIILKAGFKSGRSNQYWIDLNSPDKTLDVSFYKSGIFPCLVQEPEISNDECSVVSLNKIEHLHQRIRALCRFIPQLN